ncbi:hypothetical protein MRB53_041917 [Persea americana]|nr:hypothetical protein MRB53_041917 [Persea americana]
MAMTCSDTSGYLTTAGYNMSDEKIAMAFLMALLDGRMPRILGSGVREVLLVWHRSDTCHIRTRERVPMDFGCFKVSSTDRLYSRLTAWRVLVASNIGGSSQALRSKIDHIARLLRMPASRLRKSRHRPWDSY